ncbi:hypothetical protein [Prauserella sp. PE36]|uniref:hypothetical protein n=1 Tax=Prauserella sp. PE36 TaxID=1504709 RepID=UPI0018F6632A|nr:hypothetical protein [Prauserella sp. PE36]
MRYRTKPRTVAAARWPEADRADAATAEWEGFCRIHRLVPVRRTSRRIKPSVPDGWTMLLPHYGHPWVVVETRPGEDGHDRQVVRRLTDAEFDGEFEPAESAWEARRAALLAWARWRLNSVDATYLRLNAADLDRAPWNDPVLRAERERITALVTESGTTYNATFDPQQPDRELYVEPSPSAFRVTRDVAAVLTVLLDRPGEQITGEMVARHSGTGWKASRTLWRLKEAGWVEKDGPPGPAAEQNWSLTETGARLAAERLANRAKNQGGTR